MLHLLHTLLLAPGNLGSSGPYWSVEISSSEGTSGHSPIEAGNYNSWSLQDPVYPTATYITLRDQGYQYIYLCKISDIGELEWTRKINNNLSTAFFSVTSIQVDANQACYIVVRNGLSNSYYFSDGIIKINSSGITEFARYFHGTDPYDYEDSLSACCVGPNGRMGIALSTSSQSWGGFDVIAHVLNSSSGQTIWRTVIGNSLNQTARQVVFDLFGNLIVCGTTGLTGFNGSFVFITQLNTSGTIVWSKALFEGSDIYNKSPYISTDRFGSIYLLSNAGYLPGCWLAILSNNGNALWTKSFSIQNPGYNWQVRPVGVSAERRNPIEIYFVMQYSETLSSLWYSPRRNSNILVTVDTVGNLIRSKKIYFLSQPNVYPISGFGGNESFLYGVSGNILSRLPLHEIPSGQYGDLVVEDQDLTVANYLYEFQNFSSLGGVPNLIVNDSMSISSVSNTSAFISKSNFISY